MRKLFHFDVSPHVYTADACVITCFDARFDVAVRKFLKRRGIFTYDNLKIPGSAKWLAAPGCDSDRDFLLRLIRTSIERHHSKRALIIGHNECGAYADPSSEAIITDVRRAADVLRTAEPALSVETYFADFDGIYEIGNNEDVDGDRQHPDRRASRVPGAALGRRAISDRPGSA